MTELSADYRLTVSVASARLIAPGATGKPWRCHNCRTSVPIGFVTDGTLEVWKGGQPKVRFGPQDSGLVRCDVCGEWQRWERNAE